MQSSLIYKILGSERTFRNTSSYQICLSKGQFISKCSFGVFNSSKNKQKQFGLRDHSTVSWIFFVRFLEELKTPNGHFEINWPLEQKSKNEFVNFFGEYENKNICFWNVLTFKQKWQSHVGVLATWLQETQFCSKI